MPDTYLHGAEVLDIDDGSRVVQTVASSIIGIIGTAPKADPLAFPINTPVPIANSPTMAAKLRALTTAVDDGTLPEAVDSIMDQAGAVMIVIRVEPGTDEQHTLGSIAGGTDPVTGKFTGVHAFLAAESLLGYRPRILLAPGWTHQTQPDTVNAGQMLMNPVIAELQGIANRLRAVYIGDCPNTTYADAIAYQATLGDRRAYIHYPWDLKMASDGSGATIAVPSSARIAGQIVAQDNAVGFWASPSNTTPTGILGLTQAIDYAMGDTACLANLLNGKKVATTIRSNGFRLWGNKTCSADTKWQYLCVVRTADMIDDSILAAIQWAIDQGITKNFVTEVIEEVNAYLRHLVEIGAILGGHCWFDPDLNTADQIADGHIYFDFDFTPVYPAEHITARSHLVNDYIKAIF